MLKLLLYPRTQGAAAGGAQAPRLSGSPHATASHLTLGAPRGAGPTRTAAGDSGPRSPGAATSVGLAREAQAVFYTLRPMFTLNSPLLIFEVILHQDFCTQTVTVRGGQREGSTYFAQRQIRRTFYTQKYRWSFFLKAFRCSLGVGYIKSKSNST